METNRRNFLHTAGTTGLAATALGLIGNARAALAQELAEPNFVNQGKVDFDKLGEHFTIDPKVTYLNHASIGATPAPVQEARARYLSVCEKNPWLYMWSGEWDEPREVVRRQAAEVLGCLAEEVAITHNTTEMFNTLANGLPLRQGDEVLFSSLNHSGASVAFEHASERLGYKTRRFEFPDNQPETYTTARTIERYVEQIKPETRMLVLPHVDNTIGLRHPVAEIARAARAKGVEFIAVDGAQTVGAMPLDLKTLGVDAYATSAHKWLGAPKGIGLAYVSKKLLPLLSPMWVTWGLKRWRDSARAYEDYGTRNLAEVISLGDAIQFHQQIDDTEREQQLIRLREYIRDRATASKHLSFASATEAASGSAVNLVTLKQGDAPQVARKLFAEHGIVVRPFKSKSLNAVRLSPNVYTSTKQIDRFFEQVERL